MNLHLAQRRAQIPRDLEALGLGVFVYQMCKGADSSDQPRFGMAETLHEAKVVLINPEKLKWKNQSNITQKHQ